MSESKKPKDEKPQNEDVAAAALAEAEKLLGVTGPRYAINVDGRVYVLLPRPEQEPEAAAALFAEMMFMIRHWFQEHPEAAAEISEYPLPVDDEIGALPLAVQISVFLGLGLEVYAHKHAAS